MVEGMNGHGHPSSSTVTVLYKVANAGKEDAGLYNAFEMPRGAGVTLGSVKNHCMALNHINADGADGYHWRVRVDEKTSSDGSGNTKVLAYSWWDIQDENAKLPAKEVSLSELSRMFGSPSHSASSSGGSGAGIRTDDMTKAATGAIRSLGKTLNNAVAGTADHHGTPGHDHGPRVSVIAFKLTEISKMFDKAGGRSGSGGPGRVAFPKRAAPPAQRQRPQQQAPAAASVRRTQQQQQRAPAAAAPAARGQRAAASAPRVRPPAQKQPSADLMGFDSAGASAPRPASGVRPPPKHATSSPAAFHNETRAQRLKREYEAKNQTANRVWDDVDQRWVEVDAKAGSTVHRGSTSAPPGVSNGGTASAGTSSAKKSVGIKLDPNNARGKSATVQAAVNSRVNEMRDSQQKAVKEVRERELKKKQSEAEEDVVRQKLEPKIKVWSEEHGKKKQLRALLSSLHTVLWQGAKWKPVSLGDILDANKCKRCYHKATLVVHPDKTGGLSPEQRFLAKRIFDALTQAKTEFDASN
mmetsp:Transcript_26546/g.53895  ORF Transcript_26546/g.53895 Transcript_26546/m.53895 type:complete len:525 (+) Transcript_26546:257-1831(+)